MQLFSPKLQIPIIEPKKVIVPQAKQIYLRIQFGKDELLCLQPRESDFRLVFDPADIDLNQPESTPTKANASPK
jgi:hypothetical protein